MARIIPNENTKVLFATAAPADPDYDPTVAEVGAAIDLTEFVISLTASTQGNIIPTPNFGSLFETNIEGTSAAQFQAEMYRDEADDLAWETLPRRTQGYFFIFRFGFNAPLTGVAAGDELEVWPVRIATRSATPLASNDVQRFTIQGAVFDIPNEAAIVAGP